MKQLLSCFRLALTVIFALTNFSVSVHSSPTTEIRKPLLLPKAPRPVRPWYTLSVIPLRTSLRAFNNAGQGIGTTFLSETPNSHLHAFLWQNGKITDLGVHGGSIASEALAINEKGQVLLNADGKLFLWEHGFSTLIRGLTGRRIIGDVIVSAAINNQGDVTAQGTVSLRLPRSGGGFNTVRGERAFLEHGAISVDLGNLPGQGNGSSAHAINDRGEIVGEAGRHAFLWADGVMHDLGCLPGYDIAVATTINEHGQVAGICTGSQRTHEMIWGDAYEEPFLWEHGQMHDLGTLPGHSKTFIRGLNDDGDVIGNVTSFDDQPSLPLLWHHGQIYDLNDLVSAKPGVGLTEPCAINNRGQIVCVGYGDAMERFGMSHGYVPRLYLLTPVSH